MNARRFAPRVVIVMALAVVPPAGARGADPTIEDVKKAWRARQEANKSFRVEWVETVKVKAGGFEYGVERDMPGPHPPKDSEYTAACSLAFDGEKVAAADERSIYYPARQTWLPYFSAAQFDGRASMKVNPLDRPGWARANIETGNDSSRAGLHSVTNEPVLRLYRPLGGGLFPAFEFDRYKLTGRTEKIRGAECMEVALKEPAPGVSYSVWCDPERLFLPLRIKQRYVGGGRDIDWEYRKDDKGRWVPSGWEGKRLGGDIPLRYTVKAEVKKLELGVKFPADAFAPKPPTSSHVTVYKDGEKQEDYLLRPDGSKRLLKPTELDKDFNEVIKTNADGTPYVPAKK